MFHTLIIFFLIAFAASSLGFSLDKSADPYLTGPFTLSGVSCMHESGICEDHVKINSIEKASLAPSEIFAQICRVKKGTVSHKLCVREKFACRTAVPVWDKGQGSLLTGIHWSKTPFADIENCKMGNAI